MARGSLGTLSVGVQATNVGDLVAQLENVYQALKKIQDLGAVSPTATAAQRALREIAKEQVDAQTKLAAAQERVRRAEEDAAAGRVRLGKKQAEEYKFAGQQIDALTKKIDEQARRVDNLRQRAASPTGRDSRGRPLTATSRQELILEAERVAQQRQQNQELRNALRAGRRRLVQEDDSIRAAAETVATQRGVLADLKKRAAVERKNLQAAEQIGQNLLAAVAGPAGSGGASSLQGLGTVANLVTSLATAIGRVEETVEKFQAAVGSMARNADQLGKTAVATEQAVRTQAEGQTQRARARTPTERAADTAEERARSQLVREKLFLIPDAEGRIDDEKHRLEVLEEQAARATTKAGEGFRKLEKDIAASKRTIEETTKALDEMHEHQANPQAFIQAQRAAAGTRTSKSASSGGGAPPSDDGPTLPTELSNLLERLRKQFGPNSIDGRAARLLRQLSRVQEDPAIDAKVQEVIRKVEQMAAQDPKDSDQIKRFLEQSTRNLQQQVTQIDRVEDARRRLSSRISGFVGQLRQQSVSLDPSGAGVAGVASEGDILRAVEARVGISLTSRADAGSLAGRDLPAVLAALEQETQGFTKATAGLQGAIKGRAAKVAQSVKDERKKAEAALRVATLQRVGIDAATLKGQSEEILKAAAAEAQKELNAVVTQIRRVVRAKLPEARKADEKLIRDRLGSAGLSSPTATLGELEGIRDAVTPQRTSPTLRDRVQAKQQRQLEERSIRLGLSTDELRRLDVAKTNLAQFNKQFQGLLGLTRQGNIVTRLFSNIGHGVVNATAVLLRFHVASRLVFGSIAAIGNSVRFFTELNDALARLQAIAGASTEQMLSLEDAARNIGRTTSVSALEAVEALTILAQAGLDVNESLKALDAVVQLSVGGVASLEQSAKLITSTLQAFNLGTEQSILLSDLFVQAVNRSKLTIEGINTAFNFAGNTAAAAGLSVEELIASFGALSNAGVAVSTQGTAVRQTLAALIEPTAKSRAVFDQLGVSFEELNPLTNDWITVLQRLRDSGFGAAEAFAAFERRTASGVLALVQGVDEVAELADELEIGGAASKAFAARQNSLSQQTLRLTNSLRDMVVTLGRDLTPVFSTFIGLLQRGVDFTTRFSSSLQGVAAGFAAVSGFAAAKSAFAGPRSFFGGLDADEADRFTKFNVARQRLTQGKKFEDIDQTFGGLRSVADAQKRFGIEGLSALRFAFFEAKAAAIESMAGTRTALGLPIPAIVRLKTSFEGLKAVIGVLGRALFQALASPLGIAAAAIVGTVSILAQRRKVLDDLRRSLEEQSEAARTAQDEGLKLAAAYDRVSTALAALTPGTQSYVVAAAEQARTAAGLLVRFKSLRGVFDEATNQFTVSRAEIESRIEADTTDAFRKQVQARIELAKQEQRARQEAAALPGIAGKYDPIGAAFSPDTTETLRRSLEQQVDVSQQLNELADVRRATETEVRDLIEQQRSAQAADVAERGVREGIGVVGKAFKIAGENALLFEDLVISSLVNGTLTAKSLGKSIKDAGGEILDTAEESQLFERIIANLTTTMTSVERATGAYQDRLSKIGGIIDDAADRFGELEREISNTVRVFERAKALFAAGLDLDVAIDQAKFATLQERIAALGNPVGELVDLLSEAGQTSFGALDQSVDRSADEITALLTDARALRSTLNLNDAQTRRLDELLAKGGRVEQFAQLRGEQVEAEIALQQSTLNTTRAQEDQTRALAATREEQNLLAAGREREAALARLAFERDEKIAQAKRQFRTDDQASLVLRQNAIQLAEEEYALAVQKLDIDRASGKATKDREEDVAKLLELENRFIDAAAIRIQRARGLNTERALELEQLVKLNLHEKERAALVTAVAKQRKADLETLKAQVAAADDAADIDAQIRDEEFRRRQLVADASSLPRASTREALERDRLTSAVGQQSGLILRREQELNRLYELRKKHLRDLDILKADGSEAAAKEAEEIHASLRAEEERIGEIKRSLPLEESRLATLMTELEVMRKAGEVDINIGDSVQRAFEDAIQQVRDGGLDGKALFKGLGDNLFEEIKRGMAQSLTEKFKFDKVFRTNFLNLGKEAGDSLQDGIGGGLKTLAETVLPGLFKKLRAQTDDAFDGVVDDVGESSGTDGGLKKGTDALNDPTFKHSETGLSELSKAAKAQGTEKGDDISAALGGVLASITAIITAVQSISSDFDSIRGKTRKLDRATHGGPEGDRLKTTSAVVGGVSIALGAGLGAAVGTAIAPGVGTVLGAALGGIVASIANKAVTEAVADAITKGTRKANTQKELDKAVAGDSSIKTIAIIAGLLNPIGGILDLTQGVENNPILGAFIPDLEDVFDRAIEEMFQRVLPTYNAGFKRQLGEGLGERGRANVDLAFRGDGPLRGDARTLAQLSLGAIGAFGGGPDRLDRVFRTIANSLAAGSSNLADMEVTLLRMVRAVSGGNFTRAIRLLRETIPPTGIRSEAIDLTARAYARLPGFRALGDDGTKRLLESVLTSGAGKRGGPFRRARDQAGEITQSATEGLFSTSDFDTGFESFITRIRDSVRDAVSEGLIGAFITQGPVGAAISGFLGTINKTLKKAARGAFEGDEFDDVLARVIGRGGDNLGSQLAQLKPFLQDIYKVIKEATEELNETLAGLTPEETTNRRQQLFDQIVGGIVGAVKGFQEAINNFFTGKNRLILKLADTGDEDSLIPPEVLDNLRANIETQKTLFETTGKNLGPEARIAFLQGIESAVDEFLSTTVDSIKRLYEPLIAQAKAARDVFESVRDQLLALRAGGLGGRSPAERLDVLQQSIAEQQVILRSGTPEEQLEAAKKLQQLFGQQLELGRETLDQTGPAYAALEHATEVGLEEVQHVTRDMGADLENLQEKMKTAIEDAHKDAKDYYAYVQTELEPALGESLVAAGTTMASAIETLRKQVEQELGVTGPLWLLINAMKGATETQLQNIATAIGVELRGGGGGGGNGQVDPTPPGEGPGQFSEQIAAISGDGLNSRAKNALRGARENAAEDIQELRVADIGITQESLMSAFGALLNLVGFGTSSEHPNVPSIEDQKRAYRNRISTVLKEEFGDPVSAAELAIFAKFLREDLDRVEGQEWAEKPDELGNYYYSPGIRQNFIIESLFENIRKLTAVKLASGGIATRSTFVNVAETAQRTAEAIIPLDATGIRFMMTAFSRAIAEQPGHLTAALRPLMGATGGGNVTLIVGKDAITIQAAGRDGRGIADEVMNQLIASVRSGRLGRAVVERTRRAA